MAESKSDFEKSLSEVEKIVALLENGDCTLEESISYFEKGIKYINQCRNALEKAEKKIVSLTEAEQEEKIVD